MSVTGVQYLTVDHLGSTRLVTNSAGQQVSTSDYLPFGGELGATYPQPAGEQSVKFTGKERDTESGLDYFSARYLGSVQGRFTSPDPMQASAKPDEPQTWNRYAYVLNNPLAMIDPNGREGVGLTMDRDVRDFAAGKISKQEYLDRMNARGAGGAVGVAVVGAVVAGPALTTTLRAYASAALGWVLGHPNEAEDLATSAIEMASGAETGPASNPLQAATRQFSAAERHTMRLLEQKLGTVVQAGTHVGEEFRALGKTYDAMGGGEAFSRGNMDQFFKSMVKHLRKSNDHTVIDFTGATKEQIKQIRKRARELDPNGEHFIFVGDE